MSEQGSVLKGECCSEQGGGGTGRGAASARKSNAARMATLRSLAARVAILGDDTLVSPEEIAALIPCCVRHVYHLLHRREPARDKDKAFPFPKKLGGLTRWRLGTFREWTRRMADIC